MRDISPHLLISPQISPYLDHQRREAGDAESHAADLLAAIARAERKGRERHHAWGSDGEV